MFKPTIHQKVIWIQWNQWITKYACEWVIVVYCEMSNFSDILYHGKINLHLNEMMMSVLHQKQMNIKCSTYKKLNLMINLNKLYSFREVVLILFNYSVEQVILPFLVTCAILMIALMSISATSIVFWPLCSCLHVGQWQLNRSHTLWNLFKERSYRISYLKINYFKSNYVEQFIFPNMVLCSVMAAILQMVYMVQFFQRRISTKTYDISTWGQCPVVVVVLEFQLSSVVVFVFRIWNLVVWYQAQWWRYL